VTQTVVTYVPPSGLALEQWQALATAVCAEHEPTQDAIVALHAPASEPSDVVDLLDELLPEAAAYDDAFVAVPVPPERHRDIERAYELTTEIFTTAFGLRVAAGREEVAEMRSAARDLDAQSKELARLLTDLGVPACA
jgi:hypothetical protein